MNVRRASNLIRVFPELLLKNMFGQSRLREEEWAGRECDNRWSACIEIIFGIKTENTFKISHRWECKIPVIKRSDSYKYDCHKKKTVKLNNFGMTWVSKCMYILKKFGNFLCKEKHFVSDFDVKVSSWSRCLETQEFWKVCSVVHMH